MGLLLGWIIFVVALATIWPVALNTDTGFRTISPTTQLAARNLGLRGWRLVSGVMLPAALADLHEQTAAAMVILLVDLQMLGQLVDRRREDRDLNVGRTGIDGSAAILGRDLRFLFFG